ncbi:MAG: NifB/NifX family molybdenum-iron cluster-binding protein [Bacillota bacterium]|jgi:predicted Fe-Mo cluster-binding NifX family protein|nr:dinitrogenase iron-molybdenum cofactor biosynthesis protein [Candidatus Fermentithermobacillaceae bacterium]
MKVAVCSQGDSLESKVDPRFGRCSHFIVFDTETGDTQAFANPSTSSAHGAAIATVQFLMSHGVEAVLARNIGPNAHSGLSAASILVYSPEGDTVKDALEAYKQGRIREHSGATVDSHHGLSGKQKE